MRCAAKGWGALTVTDGGGASWDQRQRRRARVAAGLKRFQPVLDEARKRAVNESDTVAIATDLLGDLFGYDKYNEITSDHSIRSTFWHLASALEQ